MGAWCKPIEGVTGPLVVKAISLREGVIFAKLRGFARVEMETGSLKWSISGTHAVSLCLLIAPLLDIEGPTSCFTSFAIHHVKRHVNVLAHLCAKCLHTRGDEVLDGLPPSFWLLASWLTVSEPL